MKPESAKKSPYTVDDVPRWVMPLYIVYGYVGSKVFLLINFVFRSLCTIEYCQKENIENTSNAIFSLWHENIPLFFISHPRFSRSHIWMSYPLWHMKPVHIFKKSIGIKEIAYGSSGIDGKKALEKIITRLKDGWSTFITPDGPKGPLKVVKDGVFIMSSKSNTPIIPVSFQIKNVWRLPSWDRKRYPRFFYRLKVVYGKPIVADDDNWDHIRRELEDSMNDYSQDIHGDLNAPKV